MEIDKRFAFSGHAIGVAAHFHRIDDVHDLDHNIPALGSSAIPIVGGHSRHRVANFCYTASHPRHITLLSAQKVETHARGKCLPNKQFETEIGAVVHSVSFVEKLHVDLVEMHQSSTRGWDGPESSIKTSGSKIQGMRLGKVVVNVELDEEPFATCGTKKELNAFYAKQSDAYRSENCGRFHTPPGATSLTEVNGRYYGSVVKKISVADGPAEEVKNIHIDCYSIKWDGFGTIFLGEVVVSADNRKITMIRLKMGSDAGGGGSSGDGQTNSHTFP
jgi:hypothetical protein